MGEVFRPVDISKGRRRIVKKALDDLNPYLRESAVNILEHWMGEESKKELYRLLGEEQASRLLKKIERGYRLKAEEE